MQSIPFTAIVGQERLKLALILVAINPRIGGVLIHGEKGTAKSTAVRALANLLPEIEVVEDCPFSCSPYEPYLMCESCSKRKDLPIIKRKMRVIDLPVSATEDRVVGSIDIEKAIKSGEKHFEPGLLALANRGILYIDEVNLLSDHLVDLLLDSGAMGMNTVEREGISFSHPAYFILVGTMNPEEGDLRPQLIDRFGLSVDIESLKEPNLRVEVVKRRTRYEKDPEAFLKEWEEKEKNLMQSIVKAKQRLSSVVIDDDMIGLIAQIAIDMGVDGHRADIVMAKTASTLAAYRGRLEVSEDDVREAAELVLPHRMRRKPFQEEKMSREKLEESINSHKQKKQNLSQNNQEKSNPNQPNEEVDEADKQNNEQNHTNHPKEDCFDVGAPFNVKPISLKMDKKQRSLSGRRTKSLTDSSGKFISSAIPKDKPEDIAIVDTIRAASCNQLHRDKQGLAISIKEEDIREKLKTKKIGNTILFVLDSSGSMGANQRMVATKGAILSLLIDAYKKRDKVGLVAFKAKKAELVLPLTNSVELAHKLLKELPTGGKTPISAGLYKAYEVLMKEKNKESYLFLILLTDGRANVAINNNKLPFEEVKEIAREIKSEGINSLVIDTGIGFIDFGMTRQIAEVMGAKYLKLEEIEANKIVSGVKGLMEEKFGLLNI